MLLACQLLFVAAHPFNKREAPAATPPASGAPADNAPAPGSAPGAGEGAAQTPADGAAAAVDTDDRTFGLLGLGGPLGIGGLGPLGMGGLGPLGMGGMGVGGLGGMGMGMGMSNSYYNQMGMNYGGGGLGGYIG